jgi:polynucleotide 5'-kinase involved in rRNA processing
MSFEPYYLFIGAISLHFLLSKVLCDDKLADPNWRNHHHKNTTNSTEHWFASSTAAAGTEAESELLSRLSGRINSGNLPLILGIAGGSGSGKTTLATAIMEELGDQYASIINHDSYYKDISHLSEAERAEQNFGK